MVSLYDLCHENLRLMCCQSPLLTVRLRGSEVTIKVESVLEGFSQNNWIFHYWVAINTFWISQSNDTFFFFLLLVSKKQGTLPGPNWTLPVLLLSRAHHQFKRQHKMEPKSDPNSPSTLTWHSDVLPAIKAHRKSLLQLVIVARSKNE